MDRLLKSRTLRELFLNYNVKFYEFESAEAFYDAGSIDSKIELITIPCVFLNAADDMFSPQRGSLSNFCLFYAFFVFNRLTT
jgi:predicted alpha/beta-fold hydrolase